MNGNENQIYLTDQDRMQDMLGCEKHLLSVYSTFLPETTDAQLRKIFTDNMTECAQDQLCVFDAMGQQGWQQVKQAQANEVATLRGKFNDLKNKMQ